MKKGIVAGRTDPIDELLAEVAKDGAPWEVWMAVVQPLLNFDRGSWGFLLVGEE